jgi:hypothetical protein
MTNQKPMGMPEEMKTAPVERSDPAPSAPPVKKKNHAWWRTTRRYGVYGSCGP